MHLFMSLFDEKLTNCHNLTCWIFFRWQKAFDGEGGLLKVASSFEKYGLQLQENGDIIYREWAPAAKSLSIVSKVNSVSKL